MYIFKLVIPTRDSLSRDNGKAESVVNHAEPPAINRGLKR